MHIPTMAEMMAEGKTPDILFYVGCAGSFDQRAQKISKAIQQARSYRDDVIPAMARVRRKATLLTG